MRSIVVAVLIALAFVAVASAADVETCPLPSLSEAAMVPQGEMMSWAEDKVTGPLSWTSYKQCGQGWSNDRLGTGGSTVCQAGCAMCSVAMILRTRGVDVNPGSLNVWLRGHGGYVSGDLLVWSAVNAFGKTRMLDYHRGYGSLSQQGLINLLNAGRGVVVNVRNGGHWVLVTGFIGGSSFRVNDPGFAVDSYTHGQMSNFVVYQ